MKASKFTDARKALIIKQAEESTTVADICRKAGISSAKQLNWRKKCASMLPIDIMCLRDLENDNSRLSTIVDDLALDKVMLQDVLRRKLQGLLGNGRWVTRSEPIAV